MRRPRLRLVGAAAICVAVWAVSGGAAYAATWHVQPGESIQAAIDQAAPGDTIQLAPGKYFQNVTITKDDLTLRGAGSGTDGSRLMMSAQPTSSPCTGGGQVNGICVAGLPTRVSGTRIANLSVTGFSGFGVLLFRANDSTVNNVTARFNDGYGISGFRLRGVKFVNSTASNNGEPGLYVGDSPEADAWLVGNTVLHNGVGGPEGIGILLRDSSWGHVNGNTVADNCAGIVFADTAENPDPLTHWVGRDNQSNHNNGSCTGEPEGAPPLSGIGIVLLGARHSALIDNMTAMNHATGPTIAAGGIIVMSAKPVGGSNAIDNLIKGNTAHDNSPFDILWDEKGTGNRFVDNHCDTSSPAWICQS